MVGENHQDIGQNRTLFGSISQEGGMADTRTETGRPRTRSRLGSPLGYLLRLLEGGPQQWAVVGFHGFALPLERWSTRVCFDPKDRYHLELNHEETSWRVDENFQSNRAPACTLGQNYGCSRPEIALLEASCRPWEVVTLGVGGFRSPGYIKSHDIASYPTPTSHPSSRVHLPVPDYGTINHASSFMNGKTTHFGNWKGTDVDLSPGGQDLGKTFEDTYSSQYMQLFIPDMCDDALHSPLGSLSTSPNDSESSFG
ncbi:7694_t:CDS:2, partial [Acaulospora colombiana]